MFFLRFLYPAFPLRRHAFLHYTNVTKCKSTCYFSNFQNFLLKNAILCAKTNNFAHFTLQLCIKY